MDNRARAVARIAELLTDPRKRDQRVGQLLYNAVRSHWPEKAGDKTTLANAIFNLRDEDLAAALEDFLARDT